MRRKGIIAAFFCILGTCAAVRADDWPQWRGPNRDGIWREAGILDKFDGPQLAVKWRTPISSGYCGPTVADGRVYVADMLKEPQRERVLCFDAGTGKQIWSYAYECRYGNIGYRDGPRASVTIDSGRAYSLGAVGHLHCFDAAKGDVIWSRDLKSEYKIRMPIWGIASAPLVVGQLVIVQIGGADGACIVAFDKVTGKEKWRALNDRASYSAPIAIEQAGRRVVVCWTGDRLAGLDPQSGQLYWGVDFQPSQMVMNIATPVYKPPYLFVSSFYDGSMLVKVDPNELKAEKVWRRKGKSEKITDSLHCCISTPVIIGDYIYGVGSYGQLRCLELKTGDRVWGSMEPTPYGRWSNVHIVQNADRLWMFNERGQLIICTVSPEGYKEISRAGLIEPTTGQLNQRGGVCWSHPAYANKHVYIRNDDELICADLSAK